MHDDLENLTIRPNLRFYASLLFVVSVFILSSDDTLKLFSMQASSVVAAAMLCIFMLEGLMTGRFMLKSHPMQGPLFLLLIWACISLLASFLDPSKMIPDSVSDYSWTGGVNSPSLRGLAFLFRFLLSIFAIEFIISSICTKGRYFNLFNVFIFLYAVVSFYGIVQVFLYGAFNYEFGNIVYIPHFRIGGYVGEPQTYGIILVSGFFVVLAAIKYECRNIWFSRRVLKVILFMAMISLIFTFSISMLLSVAITLLLFGGSIRLRTILYFLLCAIVPGLIFLDFLKGAIYLKFIGELSTLNIRTLTWIIGYNMLIENPLSGVGIGNLPLLAESVANSLNYIFFVLDFGVLRVTTLNTFLEWGAETGAVGLVLLAHIAHKAWRIGRRGNAGEFALVKFAFGGSLVALLISANSYGGALYLGCVALSLAMYTSGIMLFSRS